MRRLQAWQELPLQNNNTTPRERNALKHSQLDVLGCEDVVHVDVKFGSGLLEPALLGRL